MDQRIHSPETEAKVHYFYQFLALVTQYGSLVQEKTSGDTAKNHNSANAI